jgi:hypothetical protein
MAETLRDIATHIENDAKKALAQPEPWKSEAAKNLWKDLGQLNSDPQKLSDVAQILAIDSKRFLGDEGFPEIEITYRLPASGINGCHAGGNLLGSSAAACNVNNIQIGPDTNKKPEPPQVIDIGFRIGSTWLNWSR